MAAGLKDKYGVDSLLIEGSGGIFDIKVDGDLIYSKHQTGEFPELVPVISEIDSRQTD